MMKHIVGLIVLYLFINNPRFSFVGGISLLYFFYPLTLLCFNRKIQKLLKANKDVILTFVVLIIFCFFRTALGGEFSFITQSVSSLLSLVIIPIIFVFAISYYKLSLNKLILWLCWSCIIISIICLLFPSINIFIKFILTIPSDEGRVNLYRGFGLSGSLSSGYGTVLTVVALFLIKEKIIRYNLYIIPLIVLVVLINVRTGLITLFLVVAIYMILNPSIGIKAALLTAILLMLCPFVLDLSFVPADTLLWIQGFFYQVQDTLMGTSNSLFNTSDELLNHIVWPRNMMEWFIGRGYNLFNVEIEHSDIGFIRQLNYGGFVYLIILVICFSKIIRKSSDLFVILCSVSIMLVANFKGDFLSGQDGYRLLSIIIFHEYFKKTNMLMFKK